MTGTQSLPLPVPLPEGASRPYTRLAGVLGILTVIAGGFGEVYAPSAIRAGGDMPTMLRNVVAMESLFRWGFAGYLIEALCDAGLTMAFWVLMRPVHQGLAMLMVVFRIISTCGFASAQMLYFPILRLLTDGAAMSPLTPDTVNAFAFMLVKVNGFGQALFSLFYGVANFIFGWLIYRSGFMPRVLGVGMCVMGVGFTARTFLLVLAPAYASPLLLFVGMLAFIALTLWLLVRGVDDAKWRAKALRA